MCIRDDGPGIPPEKIGRIFEAYYTTKEKGTGLGLAIVKHNVELYGGTVRVESELGKGARFILMFPAKALMTIWPNERAAATRARRGRREEHAPVAQTVLRTRAIPSAPSSRRRQAWTLLAREEFFMVITDARLGGMSGYEFLGKVRAPVARPAGADDHRLRHAQARRRSHQGRRD